MANRLLLTVLSLVTTAYGFGEPDWNTLRVTWGPVPGPAGVYDPMPGSPSEAESAGWTALGGDCADTFPGMKYWKDGDAGMILVYSSDNLLAGVMTGIAVAEVDTSTDSYQFETVGYYTKMTISGTDYYVLTAYFIDPKIVCTGRGGAPTELVLVTGPDPLQNNEVIPLDSDNLDVSTNTWTLGKCFVTMGLHYWWQANADMNCDTSRPTFLLYDQKQIVGFGWNAIGNFASSRFEHPPSASFPLFFHGVPDCINDVSAKVGISTMHIYFTDDPWFNGLPLGC